MRLKEIQIFNRAPFDNLILHFDDSNISVLSGINGAGKTTIISHIVDAFYELAKKGFRNEFEGINNKYYMVSSDLTVLDSNSPSFVYLRFANNEEIVDYIDIRGITSEESYAAALQIKNPIPYNTIKKELGAQQVLKYFAIKNQKNTAEFFEDNLLTYFPSYRYEQPAYLNDPYSISLAFKKEMDFTGYLTNPIEVTSDLHNVANWIMDIVLDCALYQEVAQTTLRHLNLIFTELLKSKIKEPVRLGIGPRQNGATRIQIVKIKSDEQVYPSIFNMSSGEHALVSLFCELTRQADNIGYTFDKIKGIVLVDEIDKHLHIKLQKETLPRLIKLFPNVQFIVTSHSPFLSLGFAEEADSFYKIYDLDNNGILCSPRCNDLFKEVYEMMISENEQYALRYNEILAEVQANAVPLLITEGKTDWKHLKAAMCALGIKDLCVDFYEYEDTLGDASLMNLLSQFAITAPGRKIIGIFDRDNDSICNQILDSGKAYKQLSPNIFAMAIPTANENTYGLYTSIEHYYPKEQLLKETKEGRRLYLGEEFFDSGMSKDGSCFTRFKGIQHKIKVNGVIDEKVFSLQNDPEFKNSLALPKDDFAQLIFEKDNFANGFDFSEFKKIFDIVQEIVDLE